MASTYQPSKEEQRQMREWQAEQRAHLDFVNRWNQRIADQHPYYVGKIVFRYNVLDGVSLVYNDRQLWRGRIDGPRINSIIAGILRDATRVEWAIN